MCEALNGVNRPNCSRTPTISVHSMAKMSVEVPQVTLTPADVPGADLCEPYDKHTVPALRWWLLCRGIEAPSSWKKQQLIDRYV